MFNLRFPLILKYRVLMVVDDLRIEVIIMVSLLAILVLVYIFLLFSQHLAEFSRSH